VLRRIDSAYKIFLLAHFSRVIYLTRIFFAATQNMRSQFQGVEKYKYRYFLPSDSERLIALLKKKQIQCSGMQTHEDVYFKTLDDQKKQIKIRYGMRDAQCIANFEKENVCQTEIVSFDAKIDDVHRMLKNIYGVRCTVRNFRKTYTFDINTRIYVDLLENLGTFVQIETCETVDPKKKCESIARRLGIAPNKISVQSYADVVESI